MARPHAPRGQGRARVIAAALELFADHGVSGTSLQMIAERLGVTKAAVYYQFHAKEDIVRAVLGDALEELRRVLDEAEARESPAEATEHALVGLVDLIVAHREAMATLLRDPEADRVVQADPAFQQLTERLSTLLLGPGPDPRRRVAVSVVGGGLAQAGMDPRLADLPGDELRRQLLAVAREVLVDAP